jgi:hypothetical protein
MKAALALLFITAAQALLPTIREEMTANGRLCCASACVDAETGIDGCWHCGELRCGACRRCLPVGSLTDEAGEDL